MIGLGTSIAEAAVRRRGAGGPAPLPALPLPAGSKVMALGHSFVRSGISVLAAESSSFARSELVWARAVAPQVNADSFLYPADPWGRGFSGANQGLDGDHLLSNGVVPGVLGRMAYAAARRPAIVYIDIGRNDISSNVGAADVISRLDQLLGYLRGRGIWTILGTQPPSVTSGGVSPWPAGNARWTAREVVNAWTLGQIGRDGVVVLDRSALADDAAPSGEAEWNADMVSTDGVHPCDRGAFTTGADPDGAVVADGGRVVSGTTLGAILNAMVQDGDHFIRDPLAAGNLLPDAGMTGTGGTAGPGASGSVADNWLVQYTVGTSTVACAKEDIDGSRAKQVMTFTAENDGTANRIHTAVCNRGFGSVTLAEAGLAAGDYVQQGLFVEVSAWDGWIDFCTLLSLREGVSIRYSAYGLKWIDQINLKTASKAFAGWVVTEPTQIPAGLGVSHINLGTFFRVDIDKAAAGSGVIKASRPFLRKVDDPRAAWNL